VNLQVRFDDTKEKALKIRRWEGEKVRSLVCHPERSPAKQAK